MTPRTDGQRPVSSPRGLHEVLVRATRTGRDETIYLDYNATTPLIQPWSRRRTAGAPVSLLPG